MKILLALIASFYLGELPLYGESGPPCGRIVALSPSLVEVVDAVHLINSLVGVSRFTEYPEAAKKLASIGGFLDPNLEAMMLLRPSVVLGLSEHHELLLKLEKLGIHTESYDHRSVAGIVESIVKLGALCGRAFEAGERKDSLQKLLDEYRQRQIGKVKQRALVLIGGKEDALHFTNLYVSGRDGYYADLLTIAGAENVFSGITRPFSGVSREAFIKEDPEVIFQIITEGKLSPPEREAIFAHWKTLPYLRAVKNNKVILLTDYVDVIPGPRFPETLAKIAQGLE